MRPPRWLPARLYVPPSPLPDKDGQRLTTIMDYKQMRNCGQPSTWSWAPDANEAWVGALYLRGITGDCRADPRSCGRVSCSWDNAIYYCNGKYYLLPSATCSPGTYLTSCVLTCVSCRQITMRNTGSLAVGSVKSPVTLSQTATAWASRSRVREPPTQQCITCLTTGVLLFRTIV